MSLKNLYTKSENFTGDIDILPSDIAKFLSQVKAAKPGATEFNLVHALVFPKDLNEESKRSFNKKLGETYAQSQFSVLGGDTSSGQELSVFISAIVS